MFRENDSVIFKLLRSADVINDDTQEISQQFDGESYPKLPDANMLELGEIALNIAKDYEVIAIKNNEGEIVYIPFNVAIRLLTLESDVANLAQYTIESVDALSAATVSIYNNLEEFKVEISNRLTQEIKKITDVIPNDTTSGNPLTNEAFVNSSISTNTATFRGTFNLVSDLHLTVSATTYEIAAALADAIPTSDNNDYSFVQIPTSDGEVTAIQRVDRYKYNGTNWVFEYSLNNSGFTAKQWAAINSGIVAGLVVKLEDLPDKAALDALLDSKQDALTFDNTPTLGSTNPVTSDGIKVAIDGKVSKSGDAMTGDLNMADHELQVRAGRNGIKYVDSSTGILVGNGNMNLTIQSANANLKHRKGNTNYPILDGSNVKTINGESIVGTGNISIEDKVFVATYGSTSIAEIDAAYSAQKIVVVTDPSNATLYLQYKSGTTETYKFRFVSINPSNKIQFIDCITRDGGTTTQWEYGDLDVNNVFIATTYTPYAEVEEAYLSGKVIFVQLDNAVDSNPMCILSNVDLAPYPHYNFYFTAIDDAVDGDGKVVMEVTLNYNEYGGNYNINVFYVQSNIEDLSDIRSGAEAGATAYQKPDTGIPASDLAQGVIPDVSNFITRSVNDLANYYLKSETYTKTQVDNLIGTIQQFSYEIYASLEDITTPATNVLYLIGPSGSGNDKYEEYVYANNDFTKIGDTSIDLTNYVTTQTLTDALQQLAQDLQAELSNYALKSEIKTVNGNSLIGSGDVSIHPEIVNLTDGEHNSGYYEELMRSVDIVKLGTPQIFLYTAYNNNHTTNTAICFSTCANTETTTTNRVMKQTLFLGTNKSIRTLNNTVSDNKYQVVDAWTAIVDVKQSDLDAKVSKSGDAMTGDLNLNSHELQVRGGRSGIKFTGTGTEQGIYVGNPNMRLFLEADANLDLVHKKGNSYPKILDEGNVKTINGEDIYGSGNIDTNGVFWVEYYTTPFADILAAYNAGKVLFANYEGLKFVNAGAVTDNDNVTFLFSVSAYGESDAHILSFTVTSNDGSTEYSNIYTQKLQESLISGTNIKTVNGNSILGSGNLDVNNVFIATYNQTSINDLNTAYNAGKLLVVVSGSQTFLCQRKISGASENIWTFRFAGISYDEKIQHINCVTTDNGTTWTWSTTTWAEKTTSINLSSGNSQLPTAKAVYDYAQPIINASNKLDADLVDDSSSTNKFVSTEEKESWNNKIDKVVSATTGNFASLDANGGIVDSGKKDSDFATAAQGSLADSAYQKPLSGIPASDIAEGVIPDVSQFITKSVNDLVNYYTKNEVNGLIGAIQQFHYEIYASLEDITTPAANVLYLIGPSGIGNDKYEEYVYANDTFVKIGDTSIDLSGYVTTQALNTELANYVTSSALTTALAAKQDTLVSGTNVKTINNQSVLGNGNLDVKDVFIAEYGVTSAQDTWNAVQAGKIVIVERNNLYYYPEQRGSNSSIRFFGLAYLNTFWYLDLYPNSWGGYMYYSWQREYEKVSTITGNIDTTKYPNTKAVADYAQPQTTISDVQPNTTTLDANVETYYNFLGTVDSCTITLPLMTIATTTLKNIIFNLTCGSTPAIVINGAEVTTDETQDVVYFANYLIEANKSYEINALWNGSKWVIGAAEITIPTEVEEVEE